MTTAVSALPAPSSSDLFRSPHFALTCLHPRAWLPTPHCALLPCLHLHNACHPGRGRGGGFSSKTSKVCFAHPRLNEAHADVSVAGAEIYAAGSGVCDLLGLTYVVEELGLPPVQLPVTHFVDNKAAEAFAAGTVKRSKLKHIDCRQEWVKALRNAHIVNVQHCATAINLADFFTKPLSRPRFNELRDKLMISPPAGLFGSSTSN